MIFCHFFSSTYPLLFRALDTTDTDTPSNSAMSFLVIGFSVFLDGMSLLLIIVMIVPLTELLLIVHNFLNKACKNSYLYDF